MITLTENAKNTNKKVNQTLVAERLNISVATVSKALRGMSDVGEDTIKKVQLVARELGYDRKSRNGLEDLIKSDCGLVGVLVNSSTYPGSRSGYFEGLSKEAVKQSISLVAHYVNEEQCASIMDGDNQPWVMQNNLLKGVVLLHHWPENVVSYLAKRYNCVSIMHEYAGSSVNFVGVDTACAVGKLMDILYAAGHRKIGFFGHSGTISWSRSRFAGYTESLCRLGLEVNAGWIVEVEPDYPEKGTLNWSTHFDYVASRVKEGVTAWMCASDLAGYELHKGLTHRGLAVPRDVSITGFDSNPNEGGVVLTSVKVRSAEMGAMALKTLAMNDTGRRLSRQTIKLDCDIVAGETVAKV